MTARAWTFTSCSQNIRSILKYQTDLPLPALPPSEQLLKTAKEPQQWIHIKTAYAALNPGPIYLMTIVPFSLHAKVMTPEFDMSGTVADAWSPDGTTETWFKPGDEVIVSIPDDFSFPTGNGALQSDLVVPARYATKKPEGRKLSEASAVMMTGMCGWELCQTARVKKGDRVLVIGASGGIGTMAVQIAKHIVGEEGRVVGICSGLHADMVKSIGADEVVDYKEHSSLSSHLKEKYSSAPFDAILDAAGIQDVYLSSSHYLAPDGIFAATVVKPSSWSFSSFLAAFSQMLLNEYWPRSPSLGGTGRAWKSISLMKHTQEMRERVVKMWEEGVFRVVVDRVLPMEEAVEGYERLKAGGVGGKILVKVTEDDVD